MTGNAARARTGYDRTLGLGSRCCLLGHLLGRLPAPAPQPSRASPYPRPGGPAAPAGSAPRQPSHQISVAATVISGRATIGPRPAASREAVRSASRGSASPSASSRENVLRSSGLAERCGQHIFGLVARLGRSGRAEVVHAGHPTAPDGARQFMLRCRCEMLPESLREPVARGTRGSGVLQGFAINRKVGGGECGLIRHAGGIRPGWPGNRCVLRGVFLPKRVARG